MRLVILSAAAALVAATPAFANETRVEARAGVAFSDGVKAVTGSSSEATIGIAAGYDYDLGPGAFVGAEISADKVLDGNTNRVGVGFNGRIGANLAGNKLYGIGGYTTKFCDICEASWDAGAGYEHAFGPLYGKVEYRHFFTNNGAPDADAVLAGVGMKF